MRPPPFICWLALTQGRANATVTATATAMGTPAHDDNCPPSQVGTGCVGRWVKVVGCKETKTTRKNQRTGWVFTAARGGAELRWCFTMLGDYQAVGELSLKGSLPGPTVPAMVLFSFGASAGCETRYRQGQKHKNQRLLTVRPSHHRGVPMILVPTVPHQVPGVGDTPSICRCC